MGKIESDDLEATTGEIVGHLSWTTAEVQHPTSPLQLPGACIQEGSVHREPVKVASERLDVIRRHGVIGGADGPGVEWIHRSSLVGRRRSIQRPGGSASAVRRLLRCLL